MTMTKAEKTRENRLRRAAARQGLRIKKARRRDPLGYRFGGYMLIDSSTDAVVAGGSPIPYGLTVDGVEEYLSAGAPQA